MAFSFGDGFDLYSTAADPINGYWDSSPSGTVFGTWIDGRFPGSRALRFSTTNANVGLLKASNVNDAVHHVCFAIQQTSALSGTNIGSFIQLFDGATTQCTIAFRQDGAILFYAGTQAGTLLDTYTGAITVINTWYAFEFEVVIDNTTGSWAVRKNGNSSNDRALGSLNTRGGTANNYANRMGIGLATGSVNHIVDDLFWQSGASTGIWLGDMKCITRMPASDVGTPQFSRTPGTTNTQTAAAATTTATVTTGTAMYARFTAAYDGTIGSATVSFSTGYTGNLKCSIFSSNGSTPAAVLASANVVANPATGSNTLTFGTPLAVTKNTEYWIGFDSDTTSGSWNTNASGGFRSSTAYASFPSASPTSSGLTGAPTSTVTITLAGNFTVVNEAQEDATTSYVYDSTVGHADFYNVGTIASSGTVLALTTRGYMQKSDAGTRTAAMQIKSGGTTGASSTLALTSSGFQWVWRMDLTDPNTGSAWTVANANAVQIGPTVIS